MGKIKGLDCIMLIDDNEATNFLHKMIVQKTYPDVHVETFINAEKGLDYLSCEGDYAEESEYPKPGIILLDINMPGMSGWDFLEKYKDLPEEQKARVVVAMLTTSLNPDDKDRGDKIPDIKDFKNKPLTSEMLQEIVEKNFEV